MKRKQLGHLLGQRLTSKSASPIGPRRRIISHLKTTAATICKKMRIAHSLV